jgi:putative sigma-54 modulation protein
MSKSMPINAIRKLSHQAVRKPAGSTEATELTAHRVTHAQTAPCEDWCHRLVSAGVRWHTGPNDPRAAWACLRFGSFAQCLPPRERNLMNLTISGHHLDVSPALREYVLTKMDRITRHFDQVVDINVLLSVEKLSEKERRQKAEVTLHVKGKDIFVEHASEDLYAAIDQLIDKLDRQVCRHKDKVQNHHHAAAKRIDAAT